MASENTKKKSSEETTAERKNRVFAPSEDILSHVYINEEEYEEMYARSIEDPEGFWKEASLRLDWYQEPSLINNTNFQDDVSIKWFEDGILNACYNCVDRHLDIRANNTALIWEGDDPQEDKKITYGELKEEVCKLANALKERNISKGDRVIIYMPMVPEAVYAMLACARIGAVHSVVFGGFSPQSLKDRILDCGAQMVLTADEGLRGGKKIPLKANTDQAVENCTNVHSVLVLKRTGGEIDWNEERDFCWQTLVQDQSTECDCEEMNAEDPLFILYTSGSTGKPKGVLHTTGGYMVYASLTHEVSFDYKPGEVYWCTADVGWITGHSYIVYGPLANGAISLIFEGVPNYPSWSRFWEVVDKHHVNIFYTAPTAIRALLREGNAPVEKTKRSSLRILGTVGEPINDEAWLWYYNVVGEKKCPVIDTWWQTETGGHMITPLPCHNLKPGSASKPFFGIRPVIVDNEGHVLEGACEGNLCIETSWPGQMRTVFGDHQRFIDTYFTSFKGKYFTGDGAKRDEDGYYWITGRVDDVINVSGHRLGTAEIESAINVHEEVAESAVVGYPHDIKGQGIYAYVTLLETDHNPEHENCASKNTEESLDATKKAIIETVRKVIGPIAKPDCIQFAPQLPKTRSGKIMRRILRKIAAHEEEQIGDTSTLADPSAVEELINNRTKA